MPPLMEWWPAYALLALLVVPPIIAFGVGGIEPARDAIRALQSKGQEKAQQAQAELADSGSEDEVQGTAAPARTRARKTAPVTRRRASSS